MTELIAELPIVCKPAEVAAALRVHRRFIDRAINSGQLRAARISTRGDSRVFRADVAAWLDRLAREVSPEGHE